MKNNSLQKRFIAKLKSNLINFTLGFITVGMVPRALGPELYGDLNFLTVFYQRLFKFITLGTGQAFYTKLSSRLKETKLISFYFLFILILFTGLSLFIFISIIFNFQQTLWPNQKVIFIWATSFIAMFQFIVNIIKNIHDAYGFTIKMEKIIILQSFIITIMIVATYISNLLNLSSYIVLQYVAFLFVIISGLSLINKQKIFSINRMKLLKKDIINYIDEFYAYSHPLFLAGLIGFFTGFGDRWLLQYFVGSQEQGFYGLSLRVTQIAVILFSAFPNLLTREMSINFGKGKFKEMKILFEKNLTIFYFLTAYFSMFIAANSKNILSILGGQPYVAASLILSILVFDTLNQTLSHFNVAVFASSGQTKIIRNITIPMRIIGILLSIFLILPKEYGGLGMGALGLAIKIVIQRLISSIIELWFAAKYLKISFLKIILNQIIILSVLAIIAFGLNFIFIYSFTNIIVDFLLRGFIYTFLVICIIILFPSIISTKRTKLKYLLY